jgi:hypothetical protein
MSLPTTLRVRILSEAIESVGISPVVSQEIASAELTAHMLSVTGRKDHDRIREIWARGTLLAGASRFRWDPLHLDPADIATHLAQFPDADPARPFHRDACAAIVLPGPRQPLVIDRAAASRKRLFRRSNFWDSALELAAPAARYHDYSYREKADLYRAALDAAGRARLAEIAKLLTWSAWEQHIRNHPPETLELRVPRA